MNGAYGLNVWHAPSPRLRSQALIYIIARHLCALRMERSGTMRPSPPLPNPSELARQPRVTRRLWDDEIYQASGTLGGRLGIGDADYTDDLPTQVMPTRPLYWSDELDAPTLSDLRRPSPFATRPLGGRPAFPYAMRGQDPASARQLLMFAAIGLGLVLVGISVAFGAGLLSMPGSGSDGTQADTGPAAVVTTAPAATAAPTTTVTPLPAVAASFVSQDSVVLGSWQTQYGREGYIVVGDTQVLPPGVQVTPAHQQEMVWQSSTTDPRGLVKASSPSDNIAACWYGSTFAIDVNVTDGQTHRLALYFLDWDQQNRAEIVNMLDPTTNAVLDTRSVTSFANGVYLVWNVRGDVTVQITASPSSVNAVVSGVFLGPGATSGATPVATPGDTTTPTPTSTPGIQPTVAPAG